MVLAWPIRRVGGVSCFSWCVAMVGLFAVLVTICQARKPEHVWTWLLLVLYSHDSPWSQNICLTEKHYTPHAKLRRTYTSGSHKSAPHLKLSVPCYHTIGDIPWHTWTTSFHCFATLFPFPQAQISFTLPHSMLFLWLVLILPTEQLSYTSSLWPSSCKPLFIPLTSGTWQMIVSSFYSRVLICVTKSF